jgi:dephospho-CoA kinase
VSRRFLLVGLTGGLATGKSTVSDMLRALGCVVLDADGLAREVVEPGQPALAAIVQAFGRDVLQADGRLDRKRLGALVFADPERRRRLEGIVHPAIRERFQARLAELEAQGFEGIVVWDAPVMIETGGHTAMDRLIVVVTDPATQRARALARDGDPADAERKIASQMPLADKARLADYVIDNAGDRAATEAQVADVQSALKQEHATALRLAGRALPLAAMFVIDAENCGRNRRDPLQAFERLRQAASMHRWIGFHSRRPSAVFLFEDRAAAEAGRAGAEALGLASIVRSFPDLVRLNRATPSEATTTASRSVVVVRDGARLRIIAVMLPDVVAPERRVTGPLSPRVELVRWASGRDAVCLYDRPARGGNVGQVTTALDRHLREGRPDRGAPPTARPMGVIRDVLHGRLRTPGSTTMGHERARGERGDRV